MDGPGWLPQQFEKHRARLRDVAYRMLGSLSDAEDAVQESWLRLERSGPNEVENLAGWLTTVVARVCLDTLRSRKLREEPQGIELPEPGGASERGFDPEQELLLASSVGIALLVVLETLTPPERLAFVLHDLFAVPFDEIAGIVGCSEAAARQLASRARRRVHGQAKISGTDLSRQREVVVAFLAAARDNDFEALLAVLDPDVVLRFDGSALGAARELRGARAVARRATKGGAAGAQAALVDGVVGVVIAPLGRLVMVLHVTIREGRIAELDASTEPDRIRQLSIAILDD